MVQKNGMIGMQYFIRQKKKSNFYNLSKEYVLFFLTLLALHTSPSAMESPPSYSKIKKSINIFLTQIINQTNNKIKINQLDALFDINHKGIPKRYDLTRVEIINCYSMDANSIFQGLITLFMKEETGPEMKNDYQVKSCLLSIENISDPTIACLFLHIREEKWRFLGKGLLTWSAYQNSEKSFTSGLKNFDLEKRLKEVIAFSITINASKDPTCICEPKCLYINAPRAQPAISTHEAADSLLTQEIEGNQYHPSYPIAHSG